MYPGNHPPVKSVTSSLGWQDSRQFEIRPVTRYLTRPIETFMLLLIISLVKHPDLLLTYNREQPS
jgi:hypothetical protein